MNSQKSQKPRRDFSKNGILFEHQKLNFSGNRSPLFRSKFKALRAFVVHICCKFTLDMYDTRSKSPEKQAQKAVNGYLF